MSYNPEVESPDVAVKPNDPPGEPFTLEVEFSGLCLFLEEDPGKQRVAVLMPDARMRADADPPVHLDGTDAEPHVGYVRINLANLVDLAQADPPIPEGAATNPFRLPPEYELLHRFDHQVLNFEADFAPEPMLLNLAVPHFKDFAPGLELVPGLFTASPPGDALLMRTILDGGTLAVSQAPDPFVIPKAFGASADHAGFFSSAVKWTRHVLSEAVVVRITDFADPDGPGQAAFALRPAAAGGTVSLKVANLCSHNPLDWRELSTRPANDVDVDFKWLYRLFQPTVGTWTAALAATGLPVPELANPLVSGSNDCMPARTSGTIP